MAAVEACIETLRNDKDIYLLHAGKRGLGWLAMMTEAEYTKRLDQVKETGDSTRMFDPEDHGALFYGGEDGPIFEPGELFAHTSYARAGHLDSDRIPHGDSVIADEAMRRLTPEERIGALPVSTQVL